MSMLSFFDGKEKSLLDFKDDKLRAKRVGKLVSMATAAYKKHSGVKNIDGKTMEEIIGTANSIIDDYDISIGRLIMKSKRDELKVDFDLDDFLKKIAKLSPGEEIKIPYTSTTNEIRRIMTIEAVKADKVVYKIAEDEKGSSSNAENYLIIVHSVNETIDIKDLPSKAKEKFCNMTGIHPDLDFDTEVANEGLFPLLMLFVENLKKHGLDNYFRYIRIVDSCVVADLLKNPLFASVKSTVFGPISGMSPSFTIVDQIYGKIGSIFISIDVKAAVFETYKALGFIAEDSWEEYMSKFTNDKFIAKSKKFRLGVFGKLDKTSVSGSKFVKNDRLIQRFAYGVWTTKRLIKTTHTKASSSSSSSSSSESSGSTGSILDITTSMGAKSIMESDEIIIIPSGNYKDILAAILSLELPHYLSVSCFSIDVAKFDKIDPITVKQYIYPPGRKTDFKNISAHLSADMRRDIISKLRIKYTSV